MKEYFREPVDTAATAMRRCLTQLGWDGRIEWKRGKMFIRLNIQCRHHLRRRRRGIQRGCRGGADGKRASWRCGRLWWKPSGLQEFQRCNIVSNMFTWLKPSNRCQVVALNM